MELTELMEKLKKAAEEQAAKKAAQQEKAKAFMDKIRARAAQLRATQSK